MWRGQIDRHVKPLGLSFLQWLTLSQLAAASRTVVQKDLATLVGIEGPAMVGVLDRLVMAGLVERRVAVHDRRANTVHLTSDGRRKLRGAELALAEVRDRLLQDLSDAELESVSDVFERIVARARQPRGDRPGS